MTTKSHSLWISVNDATQEIYISNEGRQPFSLCRGRIKTKSKLCLMSLKKWICWIIGQRSNIQLPCCKSSLWLERQHNVKVSWCYFSFKNAGQFGSFALFYKTHSLTEMQELLLLQVFAREQMRCDRDLAMLCGAGLGSHSHPIMSYPCTLNTPKHCRKTQHQLETPYIYWK